MDVKPIAFDSFGARSMATVVETEDLKILIDPGVALGPSRYGLPPHKLELERERELWEEIKREAKDSDVLIVTHYHYDHHDPSYPQLYEGKVAYIKHPTQKINLSQRQRASYFLEVLQGIPKKVEYADGMEFKMGKTAIKFSPPVFHGIGPKLGYVVETCISCGNEKVIHTSDVQGPSIDDQLNFILQEKPHLLIVDGPMTYMLGYRYPQKNVDKSVENLAKVIEETPVETIIIEHHFMRDLKYRERISRLYEVAGEKKVRVISAAEYAGRKIEMLEALRNKLYKDYPCEKVEYTKGE